jgi:phenylalanyl-tRNA synthetase alpha chain
MDPKEQVVALKEKALKEIAQASSLDEMARVRNTYLAKKSELSSLMGLMKDIPRSGKSLLWQTDQRLQKRDFGGFDKKNASDGKAALNKNSRGEHRSHPAGPEPQNAPLNPYFVIVDEMTSIFSSMGFEVVEGRDVETDHFNFELPQCPERPSGP